MKKFSATISPRGQLTLPTSLRERFGLSAGTTVTFEEKEGVIVLRPVALVEYEIYSKKQIQEFEELDEIDASLKSDLEKLRTKSKRSKMASSR